MIVQAAEYHVNFCENMILVDVILILEDVNYELKDAQCWFGNSFRYLAFLYAGVDVQGLTKRTSNICTGNEM